MRVRLFLAAALTLTACCQHAMADNRRPYLQPASFGPVKGPKIQIIDMRPEVTDCRQPDENTGPIQIPIPPLGSGKPGITAVNLGAPDSNGALKQINRNRLPHAVFGAEPNAPLQHAAPQNLPNGNIANHTPVPQSTGAVVGKVGQPHLPGWMSAKPVTPLAAAAPASVASYPKYVSGSGNSVQKTESTVKGTFKPGTLLGNSAK